MVKVLFAHSYSSMSCDRDSRGMVSAMHEQVILRLWEWTAVLCRRRKVAGVAASVWIFVPSTPEYLAARG